MEIKYIKKTKEPDSLNNSDASRISLDTNLRRWFDRNLGIWQSKRQYFFEEEDALNVTMLIKIEKHLERYPGDLRYRFSWRNESDSDFFVKKPNYSREGVMEISLLGHQMERSNGYLQKVPGISSIKQVDEHELIFETKYDKWHVLEHARLIDQDNYRARFIYSWNSNKLKIVENHHEIRIEESLALIK